MPSATAQRGVNHRTAFPASGCPKNRTGGWPKQKADLRFDPISASRSAATGRLGPLHLRTLPGRGPNARLRKCAHRLRTAAARSGARAGRAGALPFSGVGKSRLLAPSGILRPGLPTTRLNAAARGHSHPKANYNCLLTSRPRFGKAISYQLNRLGTFP